MSRNLKIVVLDRPLDHWNDPFIYSLFQKVVQMKLAGYGSEYPDGVLAVDATDFFGTHILLCDQKPNGELFPLVGYKSVTLQRCNYYRNVFPALSILRNSKADDRRLISLMKNSQDQGFDLSYDSSWTMQPEVRKDKEFAKFARDMISTMCVCYHEEFSIPEWTVCGILRFKTDQYFRWMGHQDITHQFSFFNLYDEQAAMLHIKEYSSECIEKARSYEGMWKEKILFSKKSIPIIRELKQAA